MIALQHLAWRLPRMLALALSCLICGAATAACDFPTVKKQIDGGFPPGH